MTFSAFCARCRKKVKKAERIIRYFDMFAGVGGFRAGLDLAGGFQCIGHCEIDKYADASYRAIHAPGKEEGYYPDARTIDPKELPDFDLLCGGFPCQAYPEEKNIPKFQRESLKYKGLSAKTSG